MHAIIFSVVAFIIGLATKWTLKPMMIKKAFADLWGRPGRTLLVIFALVIGLWGVGSILVTYSILRNDLNENYQRTRPAHVMFSSDDFAKLDLTSFRQRPEIESAEFRDLSIYRVEAFPGKWLPLWIYGVEDFDHFNLARFYWQKGKRIPDRGTILIERDAQNVRVSDLKISTSARVRIGSRLLEIPITGVTFDPAQAPATQDAFIYAYTDKKTYTGITGEAVNRRLIFRFKHVGSKEEVKELAQKVQDDLLKMGIHLESVKIPKFKEHPHQWQLNTLLMTNGLIGLLAFFMGAVLVSQLMGAILSRQIRQIGILKAIGASRLQVLAIYLVMVFSLGVISSIIAIPLAVAAGYGYAGFVARIINFDILTTSLPFAVYFGMIAAGLLLPVIFSLSALFRGIRVSVQEALTDYGITAKSKPNKKKAWFSLPLSNQMVLAFRNTLRRKKRLMVTVATMSLGVAIFATGFNVRQSLSHFLTTNRLSMKYDVQVVLREATPAETALDPFRSVTNVDRIELWNGGKGRLQSNIVSTMNSVGIVALPYNTDLMSWDVIKGRWLQAGKETEIVMNQRAAESYGYPEVNKVHPIRIKGRIIRAKLVGIVNEFDVAKIYIDKTRYDRLVNPAHMVNSLMFVARKNSYDQVIDLKKAIETAIAGSNLDVLFVMSQAERAKIIYDHLNIILTILSFLALLVLVVSALGMASATGINIMERTREIGVLRAIGATPKMIYRIFIAEGMIVSVVSIIAGIILSWPLSVLAATYFGYLILGARTSLEFSFSSTGLLITLALTMIFGWLTSRIPARRAVSVSTRKALSYE